MSRPPLLDTIITLLMTLGYAPHTNVDPVRGAREIGFHGPQATAGPHGVIRVGVRSGRVLGGVVYPLGKGYRRTVCARVTDLHPQLQQLAVYGPVKPAPKPGTMVRYHGTQHTHHGTWRVDHVVEGGFYAGRVVLVHPDDAGETLTVSAGNCSITPLEQPTPTPA